MTKPVSMGRRLYGSCKAIVGIFCAELRWLGKNRPKRLSHHSSSTELT